MVKKEVMAKIEAADALCLPEAGWDDSTVPALEHAGPYHGPSALWKVLGLLLHLQLLRTGLPSGLVLHPHTCISYSKLLAWVARINVNVLAAMGTTNTEYIRSLYVLCR